MSMLSEFKTFALKANVMDMAVGIIIGAAFGKIVSSLVADVLMPPIGLLMAGIDFSNLGWTLKPAVTDASGAVTTEAVVIHYGQFLQYTLDFLIVSFCVFLLVKGINSLRAQEEAPPEAPPEPSTEERLLGEIRDLLKSKSKAAV